MKNEGHRSTAGYWVAAGWGWLAALLAFVSAPVGVRVPVVFGFAMLGPGLVLLGCLHQRDLLEHLVLAVAVSVSLTTLVAESMALLRIWNAAGGIAVLAAITTVAAVYIEAASRRPSGGSPGPVDALEPSVSEDS
jgi:hypothetical protein